MTSNAALKKQIRAYAAEHGLAYTEARTRYAREAQRLADCLTADGLDEAVTERVLTIQQARRDDDGVLPYPFHVLPGGWVDRQDFWDGDPWFLVGFEDRDPAAMEQAAKEGSPRGRNLALTRERFEADPQAAVGLHPVFADADRTWATWTGPVASVTVRDVPRPPARAVRAFVATDDDAFSLTVDAGPVLRLLPRRAVEQMRRHDWEACASSEEVAYLVWRATDDARLGAMFDHLDDADLAEGASGYTVRLDAGQAEAWCAAHGYGEPG